MILTRKEKGRKGQARIYKFKQKIMNANTNVTYVSIVKVVGDVLGTDITLVNTLIEERLP